MTLEISREPIETLRARHPTGLLIREETLDALRVALDGASADLILVGGLLEIARALNRIVPDRPTRILGSGMHAERIEPLRVLMQRSHVARHIIACCGPINGSRMNEVVGEVLSRTTPFVLTEG